MNNLQADSFLVKSSLSKYFDIKINLNPYVFKPSKFTSCLCEVINITENEKMGKVIDIGSGSGIIAIVLSKLGCKNIYVSEILPEVIGILKLNFKTNESKIKKIFLSNIFDNIPQSLKFDLIITNPPAYPENSELKLNEGMDRAIFSGKDGREYILKFLDIVGKFLSNKGRFLIAIPSFLDWAFFESKFNENDLAFRTLLSEKCFLPTYGYPKDKFIANFLSHFNNDQSVKENQSNANLFFITDSDEIQFHVRIYEGRKKLHHE